MEINSTTVNIKIKELTKLIAECKNPKYLRDMELDLTTYKAIKDLLDKSAR